MHVYLKHNPALKPTHLRYAPAVGLALRLIAEKLGGYK
jgi:hypothetical protein